MADERSLKKDTARRGKTERDEKKRIVDGKIIDRSRPGEKEPSVKESAARVTQG